MSGSQNIIDNLQNNETVVLGFLILKEWTWLDVVNLGICGRLPDLYASLLLTPLPLCKTVGKGVASSNFVGVFEIFGKGGWSVCYVCEGGAWRRFQFSQSMVLQSCKHHHCWYYIQRNCHNKASEGTNCHASGLHIQFPLDIYWLIS